MNGKTPRFFAFHGELCKRLHINRGGDLIVVYNFAQERQATYSYTDVRNNAERVFSTKEVAAMVKRDVHRISMHIAEGHVRRPQKSHSLTGNSPYRNAYWWTEKDIMDYHAYLTTVHIGRPRLDGYINTRDLPTARELRAMIHQNLVTYIKNDKDEFIPTWENTLF